MQNLNLLFNKQYYSELSDAGFLPFFGHETKQKKEAEERLSDCLKSMNTRICNTRFNNDDYVGLSGEVAPYQIKLQTVYPGMIIGSGNPHGVHISDEDINMGFSFDYVTGQPYIPGSTVKGVLRSHFREQPEAVAEIIRSSIGLGDVNVKDLEIEIFDGNDIFFDAVICHGDRNGKLIGVDYLAPHPEKTKAPKPIQFIKILPDVGFVFAFRFKNGILTGDEKCQLMSILISLFGVGAKTNTGYGRMKILSE